jgi:aryl-alcohol dehydrogenase-like predicted oxidoreductase
VIAGATRPEQVRSNVAAARWKPIPDDLEELDAISPPPP